jgi:hypothetical protein
MFGQGRQWRETMQSGHARNRCCWRVQIAGELFCLSLSPYIVCLSPSSHYFGSDCVFLKPGSDLHVFTFSFGVPGEECRRSLLRYETRRRDEHLPILLFAFLLLPCCCFVYAQGECAAGLYCDMKREDATNTCMATKAVGDACAEDYTCASPDAQGRAIACYDTVKYGSAKKCHSSIFEKDTTVVGTACFREQDCRQMGKSESTDKTPPDKIITPLSDTAKDELLMTSLIHDFKYDDKDVDKFSRSPGSPGTWCNAM